MSGVLVRQIGRALLASFRPRCHENASLWLASGEWNVTRNMDPLTPRAIQTKSQLIKQTTIHLPHTPSTKKAPPQAVVLQYTRARMMPTALLHLSQHRDLHGPTTGGSPYQDETAGK